MTLDAYVAKAAPPLTDAYYVRLFAPRERRERLTAVLACAAEIDECVHEPSEPAVAHLKLAWWQEEIELLVRGTPRHPVTTVLAASGALGSVPELWLDLIASARRDLDQAPHPSVDRLRAHCIEGGALYELLALAFDAGPSARLHARTLGAALVNARVVDSVRREALRGRIEIPLELLDAAGVQPADLDGAWPPPVLDLLTRLNIDARTQLADARDAIHAAERPSLQPCLIMGALQDARLVALAARGYEQTNDALRPLSKLWIAWRAARQAMQRS